MINKQERRGTSRLNLESVTLQLCVDDKTGVYDPVKRVVRDISYRGLAFNVTTDDFIVIGKQYNFILEVENKSIGGVGQVRYIRDNTAGMAFSYIDSIQLQSLSTMLDPAYVAESMRNKLDKSTKEYTYVRYQTDSDSSYFEYKKTKKEESFILVFLDKKIIWSESQGLSLNLFDELSKDYVQITSKNSVFNNIVSQARLFTLASKFENNHKSLLKKIFFRSISEF